MDDSLLFFCVLLSRSWLHCELQPINRHQLCFPVLEKERESATMLDALSDVALLLH
jgi:hypothetical protein